jgi:hypothetical protein
MHGNGEDSAGSTSPRLPWRQASGVSALAGLWREGFSGEESGGGGRLRLRLRGGND